MSSKEWFVLVSRDDTTALSDWITRDPRHFCQLVEQSREIIDTCLLKQSVGCLNHLLDYYVVDMFAKSQVNVSTDSMQSSYMWTKVFDGPRPYDMFRLLARRGFDLTWRVPQGPSKGKTLLHLAGWWASVWCRLLRQMNPLTAPVDMQSISDTLYRIIVDVCDAFAAKDESPFVGCDSHVLFHIGQHPEFYH